MRQELTNAQSFMCIPKPNLREHKTVEFTFSYTSLDKIYIHCLPSKISDREHNGHTRFHINSIHAIVISNHYQIRPKTLCKFAIMTIKSWSHFRILIYSDVGIVELHTF